MTLVLMPVSPATYRDILGRLTVLGPEYVRDFTMHTPQYGLVIRFGEVGFIEAVMPS